MYATIIIIHATKKLINSKFTITINNLTNNLNNNLTNLSITTNLTNNLNNNITII